MTTPADVKSFWAHKSLSDQTPTEIDTQLAEIYGRYSVAEAKVTRLRSRDYSGRVRGTEAEIEAAEGDANEIMSEALPLSAEYARRPWSRVFLVPAGHAHSTMGCHTCYPTTQFSWMPEWSGRDEAEIVDAAASRACTVCYPSAPVDKPTQLYTERERLDAAASAAVAAERAEKAAAKAAKAITYRGGALQGRYGVIATERTAWIELVDNIYSVEAYGYEPRPEENARIVEALSDKLGVPAEDIMATVNKKVAAKAKREGRG